MIALYFSCLCCFTLIPFYRFYPYVSKHILTPGWHAVVIFHLFTGCIVPPATTTALASFTMLVKCTAGFKRRNFKVELLCRPVDSNTAESTDSQKKKVHIILPSSCMAFSQDSMVNPFR